MKPPFVVFAEEVRESDDRYPAPYDAERVGFARELGTAAGAERLGVQLVRLPAGDRSSQTHAHLFEEEGVYVLAGAPDLLWVQDGVVEKLRLRPGAYVAFPAGTGIFHHFENAGPEDAVMLTIGERHTGERVRYHDEAFDAWRAAVRPHRAWTDEQGSGWPYEIRTSRLRLRPWDPSDAMALRALSIRNQAHLGAFMPWARVIGTDDDILGNIRRWRAFFDREEEAFFGIFLPDGTPIGGTGLHARVGPRAFEIGYWIDAAHQGQGLIRESTAALVQTALACMGAERLEIRMDPENTRSAAVPKSLGFHHEATLKRRFFDQGTLRDQMVWSFFDDDLLKGGLEAMPFVAVDALGRRLCGNLGRR